jgi:hypothetical protein
MSFRRCCCQFLWPWVLLCAGFAAQAQPDPALSGAELEGRALAQKILAQRPADNFTNTGTLEIRGDGPTAKIPLRVQTSLTESNWQMIYSTEIPADDPLARAGYNGLIIVHAENQPNEYLARNVDRPPGGTNRFSTLPARELFEPFAGSDFWCCDLGLEFFHWPQQKVVKKGVHRSCGCTALESINPSPASNGYSRVVCWIDNDSLGIVDAYAYDASGRELKNFYPKELVKKNGQYQVGSMVMINRQTGSRTLLEFDLEK